mgnify:CR=1 FL=1
MALDRLIVRANSLNITSPFTLYANQPVTAAEFARMARTDGEGCSLKLSSNILKDGSWVGLRADGAVGPPNVPG